MKGEIVERIRRKLLVRFSTGQLAMFKEKERERERNVSGVTSLHGVSNKSSFGSEIRWPGRVYDN